MWLMDVPRPAAEDEKRFIGGMHLRRAYATRPLAELIVDQSLIRVQIRYKWMRRFFLGRFPVVEIALEGARARPGAMMFSGGVDLDGVAGGDYRSVFFSCNESTRQQLLDLLKRRGVTTG
jgi:hypothetical protein